MYGQVYIPPSIQHEIEAGGKAKIGVSELRRAKFIQVIPLLDPSRAALLSDLDLGEAEVITLAQEINADLVIIDERLARSHAKRLGLTVTGVLGVLIKSKEIGYITTVAPLIQQLQEGGIHLSNELKDKVLHIAGETLE